MSLTSTARFSTRRYMKAMRRQYRHDRKCRFAGSGHRELSSNGRPKIADDDETKDEKKGIDRELVKRMSILTSSQLVLNLGFAQMVPVIPLFAAQMGGHLGATGVGMVLSAPALANVLFNIPIGRLCDTIGRKPLMIAGTAMTAAGTSLTGLMGSLVTVIPCRLMVGGGSACSMTASSAYMADLSDRAPEHRAKIMGINQAVIGSMWVLGPALGGWLAEQYGYQNSFLIAGMGAALCSLGYTQLPETLDRSKRPDVGRTSSRQPGESVVTAWWRDVKPIMLDGNQQGLIALACVFPLRFACFSTAVALHASAVSGAGPKELGLMFTALALSQGIGMPIGSWLADKAKGAKKALIVPAGLISSFAFSLSAVATTQTHFLAIMAVQGMCGAVMQPSVGAFTAEITPSHLRGQAMSLQRQAASILALVTPISMGLLVDATSCEMTIGVASMLTASCSAVYAYRASSSTRVEGQTKGA